jgi:SAM-dependent MidA family methyltransferase
MKLSKQFNRLTDPKGMGELFKFVFISKNDLNLSYFKKL